jgi:hypothetical protein
VDYVNEVGLQPVYGTTQNWIRQCSDAHERCQPQRYARLQDIRVVEVTLVFCIWWQPWSARAFNASRWNFYSTGTESADYGFTEPRWVLARTISNPEFTCDFNEKPAYVIANSTIESRHCIFYTAVQEILASVKDGVYTESNNREISWAQGPVNNDSYFPYITS